MSIPKVKKAWFWVLVLLLLAACRDAGSTSGSIPETGEENQPFIVVADQVFGTRVVVDAVVVFEPAWLVVRAERSGRPAEIVGYTYIDQGEHQMVAVDIDPVAATDQLFAMLYADAGAPGEFEIGDPDVPIEWGGQVVVQPFNVSEIPGDIANQDSPQEVGVVMLDNQFDSARQVIRVGTTVRWTNEGDEAHTVTAEDHTFRSGTLEPGDEYEFTFNNPGRFPYFCDFHGGPGGRGMAGVIVVLE